MSPYPISHSMADTYNACKKRFEYSHIDKLMPVVLPEALARGIYAHNLMEIFFTCIKEGKTPEEAYLVTLNNAMDDPKYYTKIWSRIDHFLNNLYPTLGWVELIAIERTYRLSVMEQYEFPFTVDLVVRDKDGNVIAIDFKFGADAYDEEILKLFPQLPKYVGGLNILSQQGTLDHTAPTKAMYIFIRSRTNMADPEKFVKIEPVNVGRDRIYHSFKEQSMTAEAILEHKESGKPYPRTFNNNCKYCPFIELCIAELAGKDAEEIQTMKDVLFTKNTYGYEIEEVV